MTACHACRAPIADDEQFCGSCGEYQRWASDSPAQAPEPSSRPPSIGDALSALDAGRRLAEQLERPDVGRHLQSARQRLAEQLFAVAVVGEFKQGKSTLLNAILQTDVCPVDADIVTTVPTLVRWADPPMGVALLEPEAAHDEAGVEAQPGVPERVPVDVDRLRDLVCESADPAWRRRLRSVEVGLPHRLLRTGLCLVDTPGVGGLDSAHGLATLAALHRAAAVIFVTDASQELTAPEVDFLRRAVECCPIAVCVVTKTDLYPEWQRMVDLDREHLRHAGLELPVMAVSSFLRLRAWRTPELNDESGFESLFDWFRDAVVQAAATSAVDAAARDLRFARDQLADELEAEQEVLAAPETSALVVDRLQQACDRAQRVAGQHASWQQMLTDGIEDLVAEVKHDLAERLRVLARDAETVVDSGDPRETWPDIELWLQRRVVTAATENQALLVQRAHELAMDVAHEFALESDTSLEIGLTAAADVLRGVSMSRPEEGPPVKGQHAMRAVIAGRTAVLVPTIVAGAASLTGVSMLAFVLGPLALAVGVGIGRRLIKDEGARQLAYRRQQAKIAIRRYLDEAMFVIGHDCSDALRRTRRELRDEFQDRAGVLAESSQRALDQARHAAALEPRARDRRAVELTRRRETISGLGRRLEAQG
ncbi:MAG: dynamin family protein [Kineosporiaceae bacterium]|nr:dynamin family protein [Kineosporiaceae bacterium]